MQRYAFRLLFSVLPIFRIEPWSGFLFVSINKSQWWIGRPREEVVRRGVVRREIPI
jgi:hypothetical protein